MKIKLQSLFLGLALLAGLPVAMAQVTNLGIAPVAGGQTVLYWPTSLTATNYAILQSTANLAAPSWANEKLPVPVTAVAVSNTVASKFFRLIYTNPPAGMVLIPAGPFLMGNALGEADITDASLTNIYVSAFFMDVDPVTLSIWQSVYTFAVNFNGYGFAHPGAGVSADDPVQTVSWYDCLKWCNARSQMAGLTPCYYTDAGFTQVYKTGDASAIYVNWSANGYRLPTEAEWEKAARGGLSGRRFPWGNLISENQANYYGNTTNFNYDLGPNGYNPIGIDPSGTSPVGWFDLNGYGLYDMAGNVAQWCWDWYGTPYGQPSPVNPTGPGTATFRVLRGGSWYYYADRARCAFRDFAVPENTYDDCGLRCVRGL